MAAAGQSPRAKLNHLSLDLTLDEDSGGGDADADEEGDDDDVITKAAGSPPL